MNGTSRWQRRALSFHPLANLFPLMRGEAFAGLVDDIRRNGQREPIMLVDGKIIDGRNRYRACRQLRIAPLVKE